MFIDLHCHFTLKPAHSKDPQTGDFPDKDHWNQRWVPEEDFHLLSRWPTVSIPALNKEIEVRKIISKVQIGSQAHGSSQNQGQAQIVVNSLYPVERGFLKPIAKKLTATLTGMSSQLIDDIIKEKVQYIELLENANSNLESGVSIPQPDQDRQIKLLERKGDLSDPSSPLFVIQTIEGAHAFCSFKSISEKKLLKAEEKVIRYSDPDSQQLVQEFIDETIKNIYRIKKNWSSPIFFVTFAHHFYNHFCGHGKSLSPQLLFNQNKKVWSKKNGEITFTRPSITGIQPWGWAILSALLNKVDGDQNQGSRILIDTKHMSTLARVQYHDHIRELRQMGDDIPIIQSHTTANGMSSFRDSADLRDVITPEERKKSAFFTNEPLGLFDDEFKEIVESGGIIGLQLDEKRLVGRLMPPECSRLKGIPKRGSRFRKKVSDFAVEYLLPVAEKNHAERWNNPNSEWLELESQLNPSAMKQLELFKKVFCCLILRNILHLVKVGGESSWKHIGIGSDFEGVINSIPGYHTAERVSVLQQDLLKIWNEHAEDDDPEVSNVYNGVPQSERAKKLQLV
ncbi:MAG: membrane dipeptidase, partial [Flavobacteriales bacterium]|nr:membrane dipeptidase [Flavobacteriales bacterium]